MTEQGQKHVDLLNLTTEHGLSDTFGEAMSWAHAEGKRAGRAEAFEELRVDCLEKADELSAAGKKTHGLHFGLFADHISALAAKERT